MILNVRPAKISIKTFCIPFLIPNFFSRQTQCQECYAKEVLIERNWKKLVAILETNKAPGIEN